MFNLVPAEDVDENESIEDIKNRLKKYKKPMIDVDMGDPSPNKYEQRKAYVAAVAGFHKDYLEEKIKKIISDMRQDLERVSRDTYGYSQAEYDLYLKGAINFGWLLMEWGESMINEHLANQQELTDGELEDLKNKVN